MDTAVTVQIAFCHENGIFFSYSVGLAYYTKHRFFLQLTLKDNFNIFRRFAGFLLNDIQNLRRLLFVDLFLI